MHDRISQSSLFQLCPRLVPSLMELGNNPSVETISTGLLHIVKLRASQINNCGFCQHMHAHEARVDGEHQSRLDVLPAWRELSCFNLQEKAALAWTEALTLIHQQALDQDVYQTVLDAFGEQGLVELTTVILQINSWNRIAVSFNFQPDM
ncbi:carboxymuconolactone decarboxylase family protein [Glaciecola sp. 1036]|uniref:carboxymuconolactone decarboxylase family protein n=1 Tax=Alteromonadaceae TaxID=72275 RepID=UPI003CFC8825